MYAATLLVSFVVLIEPYPFFVANMFYKKILFITEHPFWFHFDRETPSDKEYIMCI